MMEQRIMLESAAVGVKTATAHLLPEKPDPIAGSAIINAFYSDFAVYVPIWLQLLIDKCLTAGATEAFVEMQKVRDTYELDSKLQRAAASIISRYGATKKHGHPFGVVNHDDETGAITEELLKMPLSGIVALYVLQSKAREFSAWVIKNLPTADPDHLAYFKLHFQHSDFFEAGLMNAYLAESESIDGDAVLEQVKKGKLLAGKLICHIFRIHAQ